MALGHWIPGLWIPGQKRHWFPGHWIPGTLDYPDSQVKFWQVKFRETAKLTFTTTILNADIKLQEENIVLADMFSTYFSLLATLDQDGE